MKSLTEKRILAVAIVTLFSFSIFAVRPVSAGWKDYLKKKVEKTKRRQRSKKIKTGSVSAVRGLGEDYGYGGEEFRDFEGLEWLEDFAVSEDAVDQFIREGRLAR
jgi:hypothetical protein